MWDICVDGRLWCCVTVSLTIMNFLGLIVSVRIKTLTKSQRVLSRWKQASRHSFATQLCQVKVKNKLSRGNSDRGFLCEILGLPRCKNLLHFFFVFLARAGVWVLFNGLLALLFSLFYVIREFDKFLHRG